MSPCFASAVSAAVSVPHWSCRDSALVVIASLRSNQRLWSRARRSGAARRVAREEGGGGRTVCGGTEIDCDCLARWPRLGLLL